MTHVVCRASTCLFWEQGVCTSEEIEYEPDVGCLTFQDMGDLELEEADDELDWVESDAALFSDKDQDWDDDDDDEDWDDEWDDDNL